MNLTYLKKFFSKDGISSSQANFVADQIKERNRIVAAEIEQVKPYKETVVTDQPNGMCGTLRHVVVHSESPDLNELSQKEGKLYALSAWLREAIKARQEIQKYYTTVADSELIEIPVHNVQPPLRPIVPQPKVVTPDDVLATFSVAELAEYFATESQAAHIGKRIHGNGAVALIRSEILKHKEKVVEFRTVGDKTYPVSFEQTYDVGTIGNQFDSLQKDHRKYEQAVNNFKARVQNAMNDANVANQLAYKKACEEAALQYDSLLAEHTKQTNAVVEAQNQAKASASMIRSTELKESASWKILIPNDLKPIYDEIVS